jgi:hypothetical protein
MDRRRHVRAGDSAASRMGISTRSSSALAKPDTLRLADVGLKARVAPAAQLSAARYATRARAGQGNDAQRDRHGPHRELTNIVRPRSGSAA